MQLALLQVAQHVTNSGRLGRLCPEAWPGVMGEGAHLCGATACPRAGLVKAGASCLAPEGGWAFLPYKRPSWHLGSALVPPGDPQAQATLSLPLRAQGTLLPDSAPEASQGSRGQFFWRSDNMIVNEKGVGTPKVSTDPPPATLPPPAFQTRPRPTDAILRAVWQG